MTTQADLFGDHRLLSDARREVFDHLDSTYKSMKCPCCDQNVAKYHHTLTVAMARFLIVLVVFYEREPRFYHRDWIVKEVADESDRKYSAATWSHQWGLIVEKPQTEDKRDKAPCSGMWMPTQKGIDFVHGRTTIARYANTYNAGVYDFSEEQVSIGDCLKHEWSWIENRGYGL